MDQSLKESLSAKPKWLKLLYLMLFGIILKVVTLITCGIAILQFIAVLVQNKPIQRLLSFSASLGNYTAKIIHFISYNTEEKPFPFSDWPT